MTKRCKYPGCGKMLPEGFKVPICDYHRALLRERGEGATAAMAAVGTAATLFVKKGGPEVVRRNGSRAIKLLGNLLRKA